MPRDQQFKLIDRCNLCSSLFSPLLTPYVYFMCRLLYSPVTSVHLYVPSFTMAASATPSIEPVAWLWPSVLTAMLCFPYLLKYLTSACGCCCSLPRQSLLLHKLQLQSLCRTPRFPCAFHVAEKWCKYQIKNKGEFACMTPVIPRMT